MTPLLTFLLVASSPAVGISDTGQVARPRETDTTVWSASLEYGFQAFTHVDAAWQTWTARFERRTAAGAIALEAGDATRFALWDQSLALDAYPKLWRHAYGNLRIGVAPGARVLPRSDVLAELYQGVGGGWEVSGSFRRMSYAASGVSLWGASIAKYLARWYIVARATAVPQAGRLGGGAWLTVRRYLANTDDYLEVAGGAGSEVVTLAADSVTVSHSQFLAARLVQYLTVRVALTAGAAWNTQQGLPARRGLSLGLAYRW